MDTVYQSVMDVGSKFIPGSTVTYVFLTFIASILIAKFIRFQQKVNLINRIPGPKTIPFLGNALEVNVDARGVFKWMIGPACSPGPGISRLQIGTNLYVTLFSPETIEVILGSQKHITKSVDYSFLHPWLGTGLLTSTGTKWHQRRKILTPAFHFKILDDFLEVFNKESFTLVNKLAPKADGKTTFDMFQFVTMCTLDIILESAMGISINAQEDTESDYVKAIYKLSNLVQFRQTRPWVHPDILFKLFGYESKQKECLKVLHGLSNKVIKERKAEYLEQRKRNSQTTTEDDAIGKRKRLAFLDLLLEASMAEGQTHLSDEDLREEVDTFMFEGHDTTAAAISWSVYLLATNPEVQARVHEELDGIFGEDRDRPATMEDLRNMKLLDCCVKEALRIFPSVPFLGRELKEDIVIDGYTVPSGTTAFIVTYRLHRDPKVFPDPEHFKPERFLPENCVNRHPYAYVPFSAGPRNCIGQKFAMMEEKTVLSTIFRNYSVDCSVKREELKMTGELILRPEDGIFVRLTKR